MQSDRRLRPVRRTELRACVRKVTRDRVRTQEELLADLLVGEAVGREAEDFDLSLT